MEKFSKKGDRGLQNHLGEVEQMNELFKDYAKHHPGINYLFNKWEYEATSEGYYEIYGEFLPEDKNAKILDVGCGTGYFLYLLKKLGYANYWGIDISKESVQFCKEHITTNVTAADSYEFFKRSDEKWDLIVMNDVIEHIPKEKIVPILKSEYSSLAAGGVFIVKTDNMAHIPHFKFIKILFHEFPTAMNLPNEVCYTNLHSYS
jgi:2-polyprenyl-3-methyl-5-hydroxy-6-metoxy-1,4-benzoquinol methylase